MPLTRFQRTLLAILAPSRTPESYLAGGTALHFSAESTRYSHDLDLFHDSAQQVAEAFARDSELLRDGGYESEVIISQPGFIRATLQLGGEGTQIDWAHESAWRFMPLVKDELGGYLLHDIDLATNKVLALAGRDEPRDFVDVLYVMDRMLSLGPLVWAAVGKDPGYSPLSLLEQIKRRGRYRPEDFARLDLVRPLDLRETKRQWINALEDAERFMEARPPNEVGCLYYSRGEARFVEPAAQPELSAQGIVCHYSRPGGILPLPPDLSLR